jgi:hypothetical protein
MFVLLASSTLTVSPSVTAATLPSRTAAAATMERPSTKDERLHQRWQTVKSEQLEEVAIELWQDSNLRALPPADAVELWLTPVGG